VDPRGAAGVEAEVVLSGILQARVKIQKSELAGRRTVVSLLLDSLPGCESTIRGPGQGGDERGLVNAPTFLRGEQHAA